MFKRKPWFCLLFLILPLAGAVLLMGPAQADDDDDLVSAVIDVTDLVKVRYASWGATLLLPPSNFTPPIREGLSEGAQGGLWLEDELQSVVLNRVDPGSWETIRGASVEVQHGRLRVRNRAVTVRKVRALVARIRAHASLSYLVQVGVTEGDTGTAAPAAGSAHATSLVLLPGITRASSVLERTTYIHDYEVEIAQGSTISNPVVLEALGGLVAEFVAQPTVAGDQVILSGIIQHGRMGKSRYAEGGVDEEYSRRDSGSTEKLRNGVIELPEFHTASIVLNTVLPSGGELRLPLAYGSSKREFRVRVAKQGGAPVSSLLHLGALTSTSLAASLRWARTPQRSNEEFTDAPILIFLDEEPLSRFEDPEEVLALIRSTPWVGRSERGDRLALLQSGLLVGFGDNLDERLRALLQEEEQQTLRSATVGVRVLSMPAGAVHAGPGGRPLAASEQASDIRLLAGGLIPTLHNRRGALTAGNMSAVVADYDVEVAQDARIADPIIGVSFDGLAVKVLPLYPEGGADAVIDVDVLFNIREIESGAIESGTRYLGRIDRVNASTRTFKTSVHVARGATYVIDTGPDPRAAGRHIVVEISVSK